MYIYISYLFIFPNAYLKVPSVYFSATRVLAHPLWASLRQKLSMVHPVRAGHASKNGSDTDTCSHSRGDP